MARTLYAAPLSVLRQRSFNQQTSSGINVSKDNKAGMEMEKWDGGIGDIMLMLELRKRIIYFRDITGFPHCDGSVPIAELIKRTLEDLNQLYPSILPNIKEMKDISIQEELSYLCEALKVFGDIWARSQMTSSNSARSSAGGSPDVILQRQLQRQLSGHVIQKLDNMHEGRKSNVKGSREMSLDIKNTCPSPVSPNSIAPQMMRLSSFSDVSKSLPPLLQAAEKCLSLNIFRSLPCESRNEKTGKKFRKFIKSKSASAGFPKKVSGSPRSVINPETDISERIEARGRNKESLPFTLPSVSPPYVFSTSANTMPTQERVPTSPSPIMSPKSVPSLQLSKSKRTAPTGPPPPASRVPNASRTAPAGPPPPPPPGAGGLRFLRLKRSDSKLKLSSHMGNLYRSLKRKLEGSNASGSNSSKVRALVGGASNAKQGMADALAELTKRSAYFHQIEEDVQKHSQMIMQVKGAISSFKTKDMDELVKFHREVDLQLEQLTDETQVLARFEDFPSKKLESLRTAAALHLKLEGIALQLKNWKIEPPLNQLLEKVEKYFNKVKGEIEALDRTKDEDAKHFQNHDIDFDFKILVKIKELMVDVSSGSMELALQERRKAEEGRKLAQIRMLWKAFQLAFRVYSFAGGQDDRADRLTQELGRVLDAIPGNQ